MNSSKSQLNHISSYSKSNQNAGSCFVSCFSFLKQDLSQRIKSLECIRYVTITQKSISNVCLSTPWKRQGATFFGGGSKLCIFFFFLRTSCCIYIRLSAGQNATYGKLLLKLQRLSFTDFCLAFLPFFFCEGKMSLHKLVGCQATPNSSLTQRPRAEDHKQNQSVSSVRNRQPALVRMEEQMSLKLIFGHRN